MPPRVRLPRRQQLQIRYEKESTIYYCPAVRGRTRGVGTERDGRKFSGKPTARGLYINNGKKVVIK